MVQSRVVRAGGHFSARCVQRYTEGNALEIPFIERGSQVCGFLQMRTLGPRRWNHLDTGPSVPLSQKKALCYILSDPMHLGVYKNLNRHTHGLSPFYFYK